MLNPWPSDSLAPAAESYYFSGYTKPLCPEIQRQLLDLQIPPPPAGFHSWDQFFADPEALDIIKMSAPSSSKDIFCFVPLINRMLTEYEQPRSVAWGRMRAGQPSARSTM